MRTAKTKSLFRAAPTSEAARNAGAKTYKHQRLAFVLAIPAHKCNEMHKSKMHAWPAGGCDTEMRIGGVVLGLHHRTRTLHGDVPDSWLVDLNADSAVQVEEVET